MHTFRDKIAVALRIQAVAPAEVRAGRLTDDLRLVEDRQRQQPARVFQSHEPAASWLAACQRGHLVDEFGPGRGDREGHPARVGYSGLAEERVRIAETRPPLRQALPQGPGPSA